jgi:hypothetical protein
MTRDKWLLTGAWVVMAAVGGISVYRISQTPKILPSIEKLCQELADLEHKGLKKPPGLVPTFKSPFGPTDAGLAYIAPEADLFRTKAGEVPVDHPKVKVQVLPFPDMRAADSTIDGTTISWVIEYRVPKLLYWMERVDAKPSGFLVFRQHGDEAPVQIAELGLEAKSFTDLTTEPKQSYRYWVSVKGMESDLKADPPVLKPVTKQSDNVSAARTPSATRLKLVGGDKTHAVLKAETYNKEKKYWVPKTLLVAPGDAVAKTGWTLKGLRFIDFTLVADVTDDDGVARVLTTRE